MKDQDDLIAQIELQNQRLRHLLLLQQQYLSLTTEIANFIAKYTEIVADVERSGVTVEDKIKRYNDIILKIQECEAQLSSAVDKGARIAEEGTVSDRNKITEELQSLKQQLHNLRRSVETKKAEHELALVEHKKYLSELDGAIAALHELETAVKSRPLLELKATSIDIELRRHEELVGRVTEKLSHVAAVEEALRAEESEAELPPTLAEKLSETRLLLKTFPAELQERAKYLEDNKALRKQFEEVASAVESWITEAKTKLQSTSGGLDMENIYANISAHKTFFGNEKVVLNQVQTMKDLMDKIWPSLVPEEQEVLRKDQDKLLERVHNTFNSAKTQQARLEQCATLWKNYQDLLEIVNGVITRAEHSVEPATTLSALRANLSNVQKVNAALIVS